MLPLKWWLVKLYIMITKIKCKYAAITARLQFFFYLTQSNLVLDNVLNNNCYNMAWTSVQYLEKIFLQVYTNVHFSYLKNVNFGHEYRLILRANRTHMMPCQVTSLWPTPAHSETWKIAVEIESCWTCSGTISWISALTFKLIISFSLIPI